MARRPTLALALVVLACLLPAPAAAQQVFESVGSRALGMAGAFVAVADDGTAAFWNPAGIALAPKGNLTVEWVRFQTGNRDQIPAPGPTTRTAEAATLGGGNFNLSYATLQGADLVNTLTGLQAETLKTTQYSATVLQSIAHGVILGSTLKLLRGFAASEPPIGLTGSNALSQAFSLQGQTVTRFDYDVGLMVVVQKFRFGLTAKNLEEPSFPDATGIAFTLRRQARMGVAVKPMGGLTLAMDLDLDTVDLRGGLRRMIALGGEDRLGRHFALRGGVRWSVTGDRQLSGSFGLSLAVRPGVWIDGHYTQGGLDGDRGFGIALRAGS
jgi:hypothetical protein